MPVNSSRLKNFTAKLKNPSWFAFAWFGMTAGVSLLATPIKFTAPTITREFALDVGQVTFAALNKAELVAVIVLLILVRVSDRSRPLFAPCAALVVILMAQSLWLLPELAARSQMIMQGIEPGPSIAHAAYSVLELAKLILLLYVGFSSMRPQAQTG